MWGFTGRSGYGDTNLGGTYDDVVSGISPNGRHYRNEITEETRDLSGADYWHLRKQNRPTEEIPAHLHMINGMANLNAYKDPVPSKPKSRVSIRDRVLPQGARLDRLNAQLIELKAEWEANKLDTEEYAMLRSVLISKRDRAWVLYCKAVGMSPTDTDQNEQVSPKVKAETAFNIDDVDSISAAQSLSNVDKLNMSFLASISDSNSLKKPLVKGLQAWKKAVQFGHKAKAYYQSLKEV